MAGFQVITFGPFWLIAEDGERVGALVDPFIAYPGMAEIVARVEQTLSRRVPAVAATFGRPSMRRPAGVKPILFFLFIFSLCFASGGFCGGGGSVKSAPVLRGEAHS